MTLRTVLLSLQALLAAAEPDDPQDAVVANQVRWFLLKDFLTLWFAMLGHKHMSIETKSGNGFLSCCEIIILHIIGKT